MRFPGIIFIFMIAFCGCSSGPYATSNREYKKQAKKFAKEIRSVPVDSLKNDSVKYTGWIGTTNFNLRKPNIVVLHHTAQKSCTETLNTFTRKPSQVSAHYVICKDGTLHHMLNNYFRAWHAGAGKWGNVTDVNSASIGIELDNDGTEPFAEAQISVLISLLGDLKKAYNIPVQNYIAHADIAPGRKVDPNIHFPWKRLSENGFGHWYDDTTFVNVPVDFNAEHALKIIGYDISTPLAAANSFRIHFIQNENTGELNETERKILYAVMLKYLR